MSDKSAITVSSSEEDDNNSDSEGSYTCQDLATLSADVNKAFDELRCTPGYGQDDAAQAEAGHLSGHGEASR